MTDKTETKAVGAVPARSAARATLARRIVARQTAHQKVQDREAAARRLTIIGEAAQAIASELAAAKARDAERLAKFAVDGTGKPPIFTGDARAQLYARLAEAEAKAEAAVPALDLVRSEIASAHADFNQACAAVQVVDVMAEELNLMDREIQALTAKLVPLHARLAGLRSWAVMKAALKEGPEREPFQRLATAAIDSMRIGLVSPQTPTRGTESTVWGALAERLINDPDASVAAYAEAA